MDLTLYELISQAFTPNPFEKVHQLEWFDYAILIPYFGALILLSLYGLHRYHLIRTYLRHKHRLGAPPAARFEHLPRVTIQLPIYNERYVIERLIRETIQMRYPRELLQIQVLDDSTDDTRDLARDLVASYREAGYPIEYRHRTNRQGFKAGALEEGLGTATGELIAIFDADFIPPRDFLENTVHYFADPRIGVVQTRWSYLNRDYNLLTQVQAMLLDGHFVIEHAARFSTGRFFNFNGTAGILRRCMIEEAGGWQHDTLTEDSDLSYRAQLQGWRFVYLPHVDCPSELPVQMFGFQTQQSRWAKGLTQVARKLLGSILTARVPLKVKLEAFFHLTPNVSYPLMLLVASLLMPVMIVRFYMGWYQMLVYDLPLIIASFWSVAAFYLVAQRELYPDTWKQSIWRMPLLFASGIGLSVINARAFFEAIFRVPSAFERTAKYAISKDRVRLDNVKYRRRSGWLPYLELAIGTYFLWMIAFAIDSYNFLAIPFLLLFVVGYFWAAFATLWDEYQSKLLWERQRELELEAAQ
jgi:cellulose synthase/poly-beta-1,6-N-acetylglucosamine synthase-like glycosyltransferase